jgi:Zn-dependent M28 family amino/carboxypeptidase
MGPDVIENRLHAVHGNNADRQHLLREFFESAGCGGDKLMEQPVKHAKVPNVICTVPGQIDSVIVVGAHFDAVDVGSGIIDNWSGASLLPSLYQGITTVARRHKFVFIGFTDEEKGLVGSHFYVDHLSKDDRKKISAMVNLDSVGTSSTKLETDRGNKVLTKALGDVAFTFKMPLQVVNVHLVGVSDADAFQDRNIPAISIHSITQETFPYLHTRRDQIEAIHMAEYYDTYCLVTAYLAYLDEILDPRAAADQSARTR